MLQRAIPALALAIADAIPLLEETPAQIASAACRRAATTRSAGRVTETVVPSPRTLSIFRVPPCSDTSLLLIARPRPLPPYLRLVEASAWTNGLHKSRMP